MKKTMRLLLRPKLSVAFLVVVTLLLLLFLGLQLGSGPKRSMDSFTATSRKTIVPKTDIGITLRGGSSGVGGSWKTNREDVVSDKNDDDNLEVYDRVSSIIYGSVSDKSGVEESPLVSVQGKEYWDDPRILENEDLIRARPRNLRLVFVGDSITRYQYLSLAYWLRYGRWFDPTVYPNNLVNAHSFHHTYHPNEDWNEFFLQSNRMLQPMELCDCLRRESNLVAIERRYFRDDERNNTLVYINISGKSTLGHVGLYGRVDPKSVFSSPFQGGLLQESKDNNFHGSAELNGKYKSREWEVSSWGDLIRYHIQPMNLGPNAVAILNAGLHPNPFHDSLRGFDLEVALEDVGIQGIWKTTTFTKTQVLNGTTVNTKNDIDNLMCFALVDCFNLGWMAKINPKFYYDQFHFNEPVYRIMNEDLLAKMRLLPNHYKRLDRSILF